MTDQVVVAGGLVLAVIWSTFLALALGERAGQRRHQRRRHEASRRDKAGAAVAVRTAGIPLGATVVALAGPPAAMRIGWRGAPAMAALCGANAVAAIVLLPRAGLRRHAATVGRQPLPAASSGSR